MPFRHATVDTHSSRAMPFGRARSPATALRRGGWDSQVGQHCPSLPLRVHPFSDTHPYSPNHLTIPFLSLLLCPKSCDHARRPFSRRRRMDQSLPTAPQPSYLQSQTRCRSARSSSLLLVPACSQQATHKTPTLSEIRSPRR